MENKGVYTTQNPLERTRYYMGGYWTFLATGKETNGQFALVEANLRKGLEPPAHTHTYEDESFHVVEGSVTFTVEDEVHRLRAGEFIHLPKGIRHSFKLESERAKMLMHLVPAGLEDFFLALSAPADTLDYPPPPAGPPSVDWLARAAALQKQYGIIGLDNNKIKAS